MDKYLTKSASQGKVQWQAFLKPVCRRVQSRICRRQRIGFGEQCRHGFQNGVDAGAAGDSRNPRAVAPVEINSERLHRKANFAAVQKMPG